MPEICVLSPKLKDLVEEAGDGSFQTGVVRLLNQWNDQPTEVEQQAAYEEAVAKRQAVGGEDHGPITALE